MATTNPPAADSKTTDDDVKLSAQHLERVETVHTTQPDVSDLSIWQTIKQNPFIVLCCIYANMGALMYGFDNIALSLCLNMVPFQLVYSEFPLAQELTIFLEHSSVNRYLLVHI